MSGVRVLSEQSSGLEDYFNRIEQELEDAWEVASDARQSGEDPTESIELDRTRDMAERCEKFLEVDGLAERVRELSDAGCDREEMAFELTDDFLAGDLGDFDTPVDKIEVSIRAALALLTEAVVAAPIEGLQDVWLDENPDGTQFIRIRYGGPVRSAGGTAQVISVIIGDYCRQHYDYAPFKPTDDEVERYVEELQLYDKEVGLQYTPGDDETRTIIKNLPVMPDAEPVTEGEVSGYRDLDRFDTNAARGGMCLVVGEGIAQKVPKIQKYTAELGLDGWKWLTELPNASHVDDDEGSDDQEVERDVENADVSGGLSDGVESPTDGTNSGNTFDHLEIEYAKPKTKYIDDTLTAGRPIFAHPSKPGGFRLRYGRARNTGHAAGGVNPATMVLLNEFMGPGTQIKTERPGKAAGVAPVDGLEGPTVKLIDGDVVRIDDEDRARELMPAVRKILDIGEIGIPYGEFLENNAELVPASYTHEWWVQDAASAGLENPPDPDRIRAKQATALAEKYDIPLHPKFTYLWHDISLDQYTALNDYLAQSERVDKSDSDEDNRGHVELPEESSNILEQLLVPHCETNSGIRITPEAAHVLRNCCTSNPDGETVLQAVNNAAPCEVRARAPTRIGARMGRPEKSEKRTFKRSLDIQALFPVGESVNRSIQAAAYETQQNEQLGGESHDLEPGVIEADVSNRICMDCREETWRVECQECGGKTIAHKVCANCDAFVSVPESKMGERECTNCGEEVTANSSQRVDVKSRLEEALETVGVHKSEIEGLKGVEGLVSQGKIPEPLEKGVLRAKHGVAVFKDGTARYDVSDLPLTAFRPDEIGTSVEKLHELGYQTDIQDNPLESEDQVVELKLQDVVIPKRAGEYILRVAQFVDELLQEYYGLDPYYEAETKEDLIGELLIGMAPHTSAGTVCRIIGYTDAWAQYGHPFFHAAKRRNCDGDEDAFMLLLDGLINYSEHYLNHHRSGWSMDEPIVISSQIDPTEIDDEAHNVDIVDQYPKSFYEATYDHAGPKDVDIEIAEDRLDDPTGFEHTITTTSIDGGPETSSYKRLPDMDAKMEQQIDLSEKTRAVDAVDVVEKIIDGHFMADLKGNLRSFGTQDVQCTNCHTTFRRPPTDGTCDNCGESTNLNFTVHEGSVTKYLGNMLRLCEKFDIDSYTAQMVEEYDRATDSLFENDKDKQTGITDFM